MPCFWTRFDRFTKLLLLLGRSSLEVGQDLIWHTLEKQKQDWKIFSPSLPRLRQDKKGKEISWNMLKQIWISFLKKIWTDLACFELCMLKGFWQVLTNLENLKQFGQFWIDFDKFVPILKNLDQFWDNFGTVLKQYVQGVLAHHGFGYYGFAYHGF